MRAALVVLSALLVASCAHSGSPGPGGQYAPLRAHISGFTVGGLSLHVNRQAHVALFEVVPGRGTSLVYPAGVYSGHAHAMMGAVVPLTNHRSWGRVNYLPVADFRFGAVNQPIFYMLVASERPLNLEGFGAHGLAMQRVLGKNFSGHSPFRTLEQVADVALAGAPDDGSWATDVFVHWPGRLADRREAGFVTITCAGLAFHVRAEDAGYAYQLLCERARNMLGPTEMAPGEDDEDTVEPRRRTPEGETEVERPARPRVRSITQLTEGADGDRRSPVMGEGQGRGRAAWTGGDGEAGERPRRAGGEAGARPDRGVRGGGDGGVASEGRRDGTPGAATGARTRPTPEGRSGSARPQPQPESPPPAAAPASRPAGEGAPTPAPNPCRDC
jgi:hypothetical protein